MGLMRDPAEFYGPEPPPCERCYASRIWQHPRYPSGWCEACGAAPEESCKWHDESDEHEFLDQWPIGGTGSRAYV